MQTRFDATLNGVSVAYLDPAIILVDIIEEKPDMTMETFRRSIRHGTRVSSRIRRSLTVRLQLQLREYDVDARAALMDRVADWAGNGGWLMINSRPAQRLHVTVSDPPHMGSSLKWTDMVEISLTAYEQPYWEQAWPTRAIITESGSIRPSGTYPEARVECDVTNAGDGEMTRLVMRCGNTHMTLEGISVPPGGHAAVAYKDDDLLTITAGGASALGNRTADSSDDLVAMTRQDNDISVEADQPVSAVFSARGRYR